MTGCRVRWEPPLPWQRPGENYEKTMARWMRDRVSLCAGSKYNSLPCELHGCGYVNTEGNVVTRGPCRCPEPSP